MGPLRAEEPPPKVNRTSISEEIMVLVPQMRQQVKRWFRVAEFEKPWKASNVAGTLRKKAPTCEWVPRKVGDGSVLWGRYVGNNRGES